MHRKPRGIEALTLRRTSVADADKVRYRVYSSPTEFIAVIAESALMAVKVAAIAKPYKIIRDLPTEGIAVEAKKMAAIPDAPRVMLPTEKTDKQAQLVAEIAPRNADIKTAVFKPMNLGDLQNAGVPRARILPPEMLTEIIEGYAKTAQPAAVETPAPPAPQPFSAPPASSLPSESEIAAPVAPSLTPEERVLQAAEAVFQEDAAAEQDETDLSPEDVEKLLNG